MNQIKEPLAGLTCALARLFVFDSSFILHPFLAARKILQGGAAGRQLGFLDDHNRETIFRLENEPAVRSQMSRSLSCCNRVWLGSMGQRRISSSCGLIIGRIIAKQG